MSIHCFTTLSVMATLWIEDRYSCDILMDCMASVPCPGVFIWDTGIWGNCLNSLDVLLADSGKGPFTVCLAPLWALSPTHSSFDGVPTCSVYSFLNHGHGNIWMLQSNNLYLSYIPTSFPSFCLSCLVLTLPVSQFPFLSFSFLLSLLSLFFLSFIIFDFGNNCLLLWESCMQISANSCLSYNGSESKYLPRGIKGCFKTLQ